MATKKRTTHRNLYMNAMTSIVEFGIRETDVYLHT